MKKLLLIEISNYHVFVSVISYTDVLTIKMLVYSETKMLSKIEDNMAFRKTSTFITGVRVYKSLVNFSMTN